MSGPGRRRERHVVKRLARNVAALLLVAVVAAAVYVGAQLLAAAVR